MTIPVLWLSRHDEVLARGTWDQGMIEALFDGSLWRVPGAPTFEHHELRGNGTAEAGALVHLGASGIVLVVSGRNHTSRTDVAWLNRIIGELDWCLLVVTGDEEAAFPYDQIADLPRLAVWGMGTKEPHPRVDRPLGSGWPPWFRQHLPEEAPAKPLDFVFAGQVTHARRQEAADQMALWAGPCQVLETAGFTQGLPPSQYAHLMADAKVAPCPSGPESPDSFRVYEALEAGCIPFADAATPHGPEPRYWTHVFGEPVPFPEVHHWENFSRLLRDELKHWPGNANRVFAWWQAWKRDLAWRFVDTVEELCGETLPGSVEQEITVIIPTSPAPIHPSIDHIAEVIDSVRAQLPDAEILVGADGVRPEQADQRDDYAEYLRRLCWATNNRWANVVPFLAEEWGHQANVARMLLEEVLSPLVLFVEHDTPLGGDVPWDHLADVIHAGAANLVRLHHESSILPEHEHLMVGEAEVPDALEGCATPMRRTVQWSQRPHLAPAWWYREILDRYFDPDSRTMIEDVLHGVVQADAQADGWERWRLWLYTPPGDMKRSWHLDSRGGAEKYAMEFRYPGREPAGAPRATR